MTETDTVARSLLAQMDGVWIHNEARESSVARRVLALGNMQKNSNQIHFVDENPWKSHKGIMSAGQYDRSKRQLYIHNFQGQFFKRCPGSSQSKALACCNYHILNLGQQCNMNCTYCYLQSYLNHPALHVYANIDGAFDELHQMSKLHASAKLRVGTGEVIDSLSLDPLTLFSHRLIEFFRNYPHWQVELKTKSSFVDQFLNVPHAGNVIVGFSINCEEVVATEERGTATLSERLSAARKCIDAGFKVQWHLDPLIYFPGWQNAYARLIERLNEQFRPQEVNLISLGSLRFQPEQRALMRERFGMESPIASKVTTAEVFPSEGDKLRYDRGVRTDMFRFVQGEFSKHSSQWKTYLCMETPESWISTYDALPGKMDHLSETFKPIGQFARTTSSESQE